MIVFYSSVWQQGKARAHSWRAQKARRSHRTPARLISAECDMSRQHRPGVEQHREVSRPLSGEFVRILLLLLSVAVGMEMEYDDKSYKNRRPWNAWNASWNHDMLLLTQSSAPSTVRWSDKLSPEHNPYTIVSKQKIYKSWSQTTRRHIHAHHIKAKRGAFQWRWGEKKTTIKFSF